MLRLFFFLLLIVLSPLGVRAQEGAFSWSAGNTLPTGAQHTQRFTNWGHPPVVVVEIGGKEYRFLLDTGAPTVVSSKIQKLVKSPVVGSVRVTDALGNAVQTQVVALSAVSLGGIKVQQVPALVYPSGNALLAQLNVEGILGSNALAGMEVSFSARQNNIGFRVVAATEKSPAPNMSLTEDLQGTPAIPVSIAGAEPQFFLFDSGFEGLCDLAPHLARKVTAGNSVAVRLLQTGGGFASINGSTASAQKVHLPRLLFAGEVFQNVTASVTGDSYSKIGAALFLLGDVTIHYGAAHFSFVPYRRQN